MSNLSKSAIADIKEDKDQTVASIRKDFEKVRPKITDERDLLKFDGAERNVIGGFTAAMDAMISLAPMLEKYGIE